jgi:hypothetical protein
MGERDDPNSGPERKREEDYNIQDEPIENRGLYKGVDQVVLGH